MWPELEAKLAALPKPSGAAPPRRSPDDMLEEVLELVRFIVPQVRDIAVDMENERMSRERQALSASISGYTGVTGLLKNMGLMNAGISGSPAMRALEEEAEERARLVHKWRKKPEPKGE